MSPTSSTCCGMCPRRRSSLVHRLLVLLLVALQLMAVSAQPLGERHSHRCRRRTFPRRSKAPPCPPQAMLHGRSMLRSRASKGTTGRSLCCLWGGGSTGTLSRRPPTIIARLQGPPRGIDLTTTRCPSGYRQSRRVSRVPLPCSCVAFVASGAHAHGTTLMSSWAAGGLKESTGATWSQRSAGVSGEGGYGARSLGSGISRSLTDTSIGCVLLDILSVTAEAPDRCSSPDGPCSTGTGTVSSGGNGGRGFVGEAVADHGQTGPLVISHPRKSSTLQR